GCRADHDAGVWPDHAALRPSSFDGIKIRRCSLLSGVAGGMSDLHRFLCHDRICDLFPVSGALVAETRAARFGRLLPQSDRCRLYLSAVVAIPIPSVNEALQSLYKRRRFSDDDSRLLPSPA